MYKEGDFVERLVGCELDQNRNCEKEMDLIYQKSKGSIGKTSAKGR